MISEVKIPFQDVNDDSAVLVEWYVKQGDMVKAGDNICALETTKTVFDLVADRGGFVVSFRFAEGDKIPVKETICFIADTLNGTVPQNAGVKEPVPPSDEIVNATDKARQRAVELGVDISSIRIDGIIREKDVIEHAKKGILAARPKEAAAKPTKMVPVSPSLPEDVKNDPDFRNWSSEEKIRFYTQRGAEIGKRVTIGRGSVILSKAIRIGDDVVIGNDNYIDTDELSIGRMTVIGNDCNMMTSKLDIGDMTTVGNRVRIDVSGGKTSESGVKVGVQSLICDEVYLNASRAILVGSKVALSPRAIVYTHSYWQSVLDGYQASFGGVNIGDQSWIGSAAQLLPGVHVGEGSIVASNSLVSSTVAPFTMVGGVPAVQLKNQLKKDLAPAVKEKVVTALIHEFAEELRKKGCEVNEENAMGAKRCSVYSAKHRDNFNLLFVHGTPQVPIGEKNLVLAGFVLPLVETGESVIFDLSRMEVRGAGNRLSNELRNFLRRRGITFAPIYWRFKLNEGLE